MMKLTYLHAALVAGLSLATFVDVASAQAVRALRIAPRIAIPSASSTPTEIAEVAVEPTPADAAEPDEATAASDSAAKTGEDAKKEQEKQQKLQKISQLKFDRRPSSILAAWHKFEQERLKEDEKPKAETASEKSSDKGADADEASQPDAKASPAADEPAPSGEAGSAKSDSAEPAAAPDAANPTEAEPTQADGQQASSAAQAETDDDKQSDAAAAAPQEGQPQEAAAASTDSPDAKTEAEADKGPDFDTQLKDFQRDITLGRWKEAAALMASLDEELAVALYQQLVRSLAAAPNFPPADASPEVLAEFAQAQNQRGGRPEANALTADDLLAIVAMAPKEFDEKQVRQLAGMVRVYLANNFLIEDLIDALKQNVASEEGRRLTKLQVAELLVAAGHTARAKEFLPSMEEAVAEKNYQALNLLSTYYVSLYQKDRKSDDLESAWKAVQEVLSADEVQEAEQTQALQRAVELAPSVRDSLGDAWLADSFTGQPERGVRIISTIGGLASRALQTKSNAPEGRLQTLRLQTTAVEQLVEAAPQLAAEWSEQLTLLAQVWLREAEITYQLDTSTTRGPVLQRDVYGNFFYNAAQQQMEAQAQNNRMRPIPVADLLKIHPSEGWLEHVREGLKPQISKTLAMLYLKVNEEDAAFPHIEQLAQSHPELANDLVKEFLRVWIDNHDPNANRNRTNSYMFMYGFERRAESIPLTRSKQQRNLQELAALVKRLNALPLDDVDEEQLAKAFTACHSAAEVYQLDAIEAVFGPVEDLKPETLASLAQQMRTNLVGLWRAPATQNQAKTNRKQRDIEAEVFRGYQVALATVEGGLARHPDDWSLMLAKASLEHDASDYRREIAPDAKFVARLEDSFAGFRRAAELYAKTIGEIPQEKETTRPYEVWYYGSLGACDPDRLDQKKPHDPGQLALIREAILALPGEAAQRHMGMFANTLFTRMSAVAPALKYRYIESGLSIVGEHERAAEARKVYDYYSDLVTEIKLETKIDGSDAVGHGRPFGVFVNILHTREIERESGGFTRYLQNQNNGSVYYYNYGRPLENYRDKFEERVAAAMGDQFEVLSITFQSEDVNSRSVARDGWRYTPYAYLLVKAKGPKADKLPALQLDLDFLDTSGFVVLPIASSPLPLDAASAKPPARPAAKISLVQTLDERHVDEGKLILEVKASGQGLIPELDQLVKIAPAGFDVVDVKDEGLSVSRFDPESPDNVVLSERNWLVSMKTKANLPASPSTFEFGDPLFADIKESTFQRYDDADLASVAKTVDLKERYASAGSSRWLWYALPLTLAAVGLAIAIASWARRRPPAVTAALEVPERITPFSVLTLLNRIEERNGLDASGLAMLHDSRNRIERFYFQDKREPEPDLEQIATTWVSRARPRTP